MLKNYFITAIRNFSRHKIFSVINILGLAIGISAALVIYLIADYDFNFDKFEKDRNRIYRVVSEFKFSGQEIHNPGVPGPLAEAVKNEVTGIAATIPFHQPNYDVKVTVEEKRNGHPVCFKKQNDIIFADDRYFKLLSFQWMAGTPQTATQEPYQVVLTAQRAKLYFPSLAAAAVIGKTITYNDSIHATVTGIVKDVEYHTDFFFKEFISLATIANTVMRNGYGFDQWWGTDGTSQLFLQLGQGSTVQQVEKQLAAVMKKYRKDQKQTIQDSYVFKLQPLNDLHFNSRFGTFEGWNGGDRSSVSSKPVLYGLLTVGVFLLVLGCANFINLATAQATQRAKEIGIRKTMGSSKTQLRWQFLIETFIITLTASILSVVMVPLLLKVFEDFIPRGLHFSIAAYPTLTIFMLVLMVIITFLSGFYPSIILSGYNPVLALKNQSASSAAGSRKLWIRKTLTVSQFVIAQVFIMATLIVSSQIRYTLNKDLGFKKDAVINFTASFNEKYIHNRAVLLKRLKVIPEIKMISLANIPPSSIGQRSGTWSYTDEKHTVETHAQITFADTNYLKLYQIKLLAGDNVSFSDTVKDLVINETYARLLGFDNPQQAVGKWLTSKRNDRKYQVTGVMADFNQRSLHEEIQPQILSTNLGETYCFNVLLQPASENAANWKTAISKMTAIYSDLYPDEDFDYNFLDETIAGFYKNEQNIGHLLKWATGLAVFISCLGLLGLVIYTTNTRTKEIGVRKVLGASVTQIVSILSKDFIVLVMTAFFIATPIAWWSSHKWLENFSYKANISWWLFLVAGGFMIAIALLTLAFQTIRAAIANPVKSLRSE